MQKLVEARFILDFIKRVLNDQTVKRRIIDKTVVYGNIKLLDENGFIEATSSLSGFQGPAMSNFLMTLNEIAEGLIDRYENLLDKTHNEPEGFLESSYWNITDQGLVLKLKEQEVIEDAAYPKNTPVAQEYENHELIQYCLTVAEHTHSYGPLETKANYTNLVDIIKDSRLLTPLEALLSHELDLVEPSTFRLKNDNAGWRSAGIVLIKTLDKRGYFTRKIKNKEVRAILRHTFHRVVKKDLIKKGKADSLDFCSKIPGPDELLAQQNSSLHHPHERRFKASR